MPIIILSDREIKLLKKKDSHSKKIKDTINELAGDLGGYGIDVVDHYLNDVSNEFSAADPEGLRSLVDATLSTVDYLTGLNGS